MCTGWGTRRRGEGVEAAMRRPGGHGSFPMHTPPESGFWVGKTVATKKGGLLDVGIKIAGEEVFTRPQSEVSKWLV